MKYALFILPRAAKAMERLPSADYSRVKAVILQLAANPRPHGSVKLAGREGWRIRAGSYRVIYEIDDSKKHITILAAGHRREIYR